MIHINLRKIDHITIKSSDYEQTKSFYKELGFKIVKENYIEKQKRYELSLKLGNSEIEIIAYKDKQGIIDGINLHGLSHLSIEVGNVDEAAKELKAKGVEVETVKVDEETLKKYTFFKDPDGMWIELYEVSIWDYVTKNQYL